MVATRKKPSAPAPPTSRTNSTQALPRAVNPKSTPSNLSTSSDNEPDLSQQLNGTDLPNGALKSKQSSKQSKGKAPLVRKQKRSWLDRIFFLFLTTFSIYALYTCPYDVNDENTVCRSLSTYRQHVLEPYVIPPIRSAITHPAVVEQYEKYAQPFYETYIEPVTPYVAAAQKRTTPYIRHTIRISQDTSSRVWSSAIKPYWIRVVVPRYNLYLQPHVTKYVSPLVRRAQHYTHQAEPYVRTFAHQTSIYARDAQRYLALAYYRIKPHAIRTYDIAKPYALRGYAQAKPFVLQMTDVAQTKGKHAISQAVVLFQLALGRVGDLRREFVDPHVLRIWEKAVEKSGLSTAEQPSSTIAAIPSTTPRPSDLPVSLDDIPDLNVDVEPSTVEAAPEPTIIPESVTVESIPLSSTVTVEPTASVEPPETLDEPTPGVPEATPVEILEKAASVAEASAAHASNVIAELESEIEEAEAAQVPFEPSPNPVKAPTPTPSEEPIAETTVVSQATTQQTDSSSEPEDLDDFLRDIGIDEPNQAQESEPETVVLPTAAEDEEAKKAATAAKRVEIVGRHVRWQSELDSLVKDLEERVKQEIKSVREDAIRHIGVLPSDTDSTLMKGKGQQVLDKVQTDGEKLLKGLENYLNKLVRRKVTPENLEKEKEKWAKVVEKVEEKFKTVVRTVQEDVHNWYVQVREQEGVAVTAAANEVKTLADRAQTDLGLDYAWLDDVTYYDWQNYHDLMRTYERFDQTARSLQNGTHSDAPEDLLIPALNNLDREVQDMISGFAMRMHTLVREGDRWLEGTATEGDILDENVDEPRVSILPISPEPSTEKVDPENVVIGKSAEQIEQMLKQAAEIQRDEL